MIYFLVWGRPFYRRKYHCARGSQLVSRGTWRTLRCRHSVSPPTPTCGPRFAPRDTRIPPCRDLNNTFVCTVLDPHSLSLTLLLTSTSASGCSLTCGWEFYVLRATTLRCSTQLYILHCQHTTIYTYYFTWCAAIASAHNFCLPSRGASMRSCTGNLLDGVVPVIIFTFCFWPWKYRNFLLFKCAYTFFYFLLKFKDDVSFLVMIYLIILVWCMMKY